MAINVGTLQALLKIDDRGVDRAISRAMAGLKALPETTTLQILADATDVLSTATSAEAALTGIDDETVEIDGDPTDALSAVGEVESGLTGIEDETVAMLGDPSDALGALSQLTAELDGIEDETVGLSVDAAQALAESQSLAQTLDGIEDETVAVMVDGGSALGEIQSVEAGLAGLEDQTVRVNVEAESLAGTLAGLDGGGLGSIVGPANAAGGSLGDAAMSAGMFGGALDLADGKAGALAKGAGALIAGGALISFLGGSANAAGDLAEAVNVVGLQFGDLSDEFLAFTEGAPQKFGLSTRAANELGAGLQGLISEMGLANAESADWSKKLLTLGADMGSAFNKEPAEAIAAIGGALRGETEPIRAFNVMLSATAVEAKAASMGLLGTAVDTGKVETARISLMRAEEKLADLRKSGTASALDIREAENGVAQATDKVKEAMAGSAAEMGTAEKAQATLALIMESTNKIQGDFANTADGLANTQRTLAGETEDLKAAFGENLAPALASVLGFITDLLNVFGELPGPVQNLIVVGGLLAVALGGIAAVAPLVAGGFGLITGAAAPWLLAIGAVIAIGYLLIENWDSIKETALKVILFVVDKFLWLAEKIVGAMVIAFGWVPGMGDKLRAAQDKIGQFRDTTNAAMDAINTDHPANEITHLIDLVGALRSPQPIVVLADASQAQNAIDRFIGMNNYRRIMVSVQADASSIVARGGRKWHSGGVIPGSGEVNATLLSGEGVLPRSAMAALGPANFETLRKMHSGGVVLPEGRMTLPSGSGPASARRIPDGAPVFMPGAIVVQGSVISERDLADAIDRAIRASRYRSGH